MNICKKYINLHLHKYFFLSYLLTFSKKILIFVSCNCDFFDFAILIMPLFIISYSVVTYCI